MRVLSGYRVLDLTDETGWFCSRLLADMGAEVILLESPGDDAINRRSAHFAYLNAGKRSITLDLSDSAGREVFKCLVKAADVLVESASPGYMESPGLGYVEMSQINPRLIVASITGFGQNGPYKDFKASDIVVAALGGQMYASGEPGTPPLKPFGNQAYNLAGLFAANGILLALWDRHTSGRGQHLDISTMECVAAALDHVLVRYLYEGVVSRRRGSLHWNNAFRLFPCRNGYILLSLFHQWETLVELLQAEGMADDLTDEKWRDREERLRHLDHIISVLEKWTLSHNVDELVEMGQLMRFPWAKVTTIPELVNSPQLAERNFFIDKESPDGRKYKYPGAPIKLSRAPWRAGGHVPGKGEHNNEIYREIGLSAVEIKALKTKRVI